MLDAIISYERKGVGVDMMLKSLLGVARLCMLYSDDPADKKKFFAVADSIIECRMLCNFGRPIMTLRQGLKSLRLKDKLEFWHWLFLVLSYFLRVPEQVSGDFNYLQKVVFHKWSRQRLSFCYRFFKSLSLTCCILSELCRRADLHAGIAAANTVDERERAHLDLTVSNVLMVRTLCDMYVYYKWIPSYKPNETLEYICGSLSGVLGAWLVWKDTRYIRPNVVVPTPAQTAQAIMEKEKFTRMASVAMYQSADDSGSAAE